MFKTFWNPSPSISLSLLKKFKSAIFISISFTTFKWEQFWDSNFDFFLQKYFFSKCRIFRHKSRNFLSAPFLFSSFREPADAEQKSLKMKRSQYFQPVAYFEKISTPLYSKFYVEFEEVSGISRHFYEAQTLNFLRVMS